MKTLLLLIFIGLFAPFANAQTFSIRGKVTDKENTALPSTTLLLLNAGDSTMVNFGLTNSDGVFEISNVRQGSYLVRVTYVGYNTLFLPVGPPVGQTVDMGVIIMEDQRTLLREVTVSEERIPMRVRGDTIEYDALAFRVQPHEVVEDLLKRLPGIEVDRDGGVTAQGEQVRRVLVDGREFFGRDPKMATQNLPADAVSKVHVFDERSEQARFTGIDDGERERTMNLELKEDRRQGMFGKTSLGYGPDDRFTGSTNINRFDSKGQYSLLGMGNNINQQGFSVADYMNFSGGTQSLLGGGGGGGFGFGGRGNDMGVPVNFDGRASSNGVMTSWAGGLNMSRKMFGTTDVTASYFYNQLDHDMNQNTDRENFMPDGNYDFRQISDQDNQNYNHRMNLRVDHTFNSNNSLLLTTNGSHNKTNTFQNSSSSTLSSTGQVLNASDQFNNATGKRMNIASNLLWRKRFSTPGRTLTTGLNLNASSNDRASQLEAFNRFFTGARAEQIILQDNFQESLNRSIGGNMTYTEPLGNRLYLEANYRITQNRNEVDQQVYDIVNNTSVVNDQLTNIYNSTYLYQRGGINFRVSRDMYSFTLGSSVQATSLQGELISKNQEINRDYLNILPVARFNYDFSNFRRLMVNYETSVQEPGITQLQPLIDNRDPLNIYQGNPELRPSFRNSVNIRFNSFNPVNLFGYFTFLSADYTTNAIANSVTVDERRVRTITPVNTDNNLNLRGNFNLTLNLSKLKSRMNVGTNLSRRESIDILNEVHQRITNNTFGGNIRYSFTPVDQFDLSLSANVNQQLTAYQFSTLEQAYLNQTYNADVNWNFFKYYRLNASFNYQIYAGRTAEFDRKIPMLNFGFSRSFLRNNSGELRLTGINLLNKDLGVTQRFDANYLEQQVTNSLGRYFLLTFTYSLNQALNVLDGAHRGGGRGPGRGMMIVH